jgi:flavin reductase (DIM6/NTAB) family NADH-FMN oxidoreductase RutF
MKKSLGAKTIAYPAPVFAIGTYDLQGRPNMMTAAWAGLCCSSPACIAVALRKATYSHGSIVEEHCRTQGIYRKYPF